MRPSIIVLLAPFCGLYDSFYILCPVVISVLYSKDSLVQVKFKSLPASIVFVATTF